MIGGGGIAATVPPQYFCKKGVFGVVVMPIFAASLLPPLEASQQVTMTLAGLLTETGGAMTSLVPDFTVYAAGAVVVGLAIYGIRRVIKAGR